MVAMLLWKSPGCGVAPPVGETRASMLTRLAPERLRPGIIEFESSSVNASGHRPVVVRMIATGGPGESSDLATMNSVSPSGTLPLSAAARSTLPLIAAGAVALAGAEV